MKKLFFTAVLLSGIILSHAQNPSMTISHAGISPDKTLTVYISDSIDFIFGGGGAHPMTEGWQSGESSTPIPFETQTVTSSIPSVTFILETAGTYYFHCGTNPGNSDNWGKITVLDTTTTSIFNESKIFEPNIYPNPVTDMLIIEGLNGSAEIFELNGRKVLDINSTTTNVEALPDGMYIVKTKEWNTIIIKK